MSLEVGVQQCEGDDCQVSNDAEYVSEEEKYKDYKLNLWDVCQYQQNEFCQKDLVFHC